MIPPARIWSNFVPLLLIVDSFMTDSMLVSPSFSYQALAILSSIALLLRSDVSPPRPGTPLPKTNASSLDPLSWTSFWLSTLLISFACAQRTEFALLLIPVSVLLARTSFLRAAARILLLWIVVVLVLLVTDWKIGLPKLTNDFSTTDPWLKFLTIDTKSPTVAIVLVLVPFWFTVGQLGLICSCVIAVVLSFRIPFISEGDGFMGMIGVCRLMCWIVFLVIAGNQGSSHGRCAVIVLAVVTGLVWWRFAVDDVLMKLTVVCE
jgi:hypothetical protein